MANSVNNIKVTVGKELVAGTAVARTAVLPIKSSPSLDKKGTTDVDPVITGTNMDSGQLLTSYDVGGGIPLSFRPVAGVGITLKSLLGTEEAPIQVGGCIAIRYTGSEASCKITASASADELVSAIGTKGSEAGDSNFGTSGTIDLTDTATDTIDELVAVINAYDDYDCKKMFEESADYDTSNIIDITAGVEGKNTYALIWFSSPTSGVYKHTFKPDNTNTERPTMSVQKDGYQDNFLYDGIVADALSLSGALKAFVEADIDLLGMEETGDQTASELTLEDRDPMAFSNGFSSISDKDAQYISSMSVAVKNNHSTEGYGQGSLGRIYQSKGKFEVTGDVQVRLDADSFLLRNKAFTSDMIALLFYLKGRMLSGNIPECAFIELPYCGIKDPDFPDSNGVLDLKFNYTAYQPKGTIYNSPLAVTILTTDADAY